jgi:hypothetical protein
MDQTHKQEGYSGIYLERSGKDGRSLVETLIAQPEFPLEEYQKKEAYEFEKSIADHELTTGITIDETIRSHKDEAITAPYFFAEAFLKGKVNLPESIDPAPHFSSLDSVYGWLASSARDSKIDEVTLTKMSKESTNYYKQTIAELLLSGGTPEPSTMDHMSIVLNPTEMIKKSLLVVQARQYIHELHCEYEEGGDRVEGAKRVLADIYLAKVNSLVAGDMITLDYLANQSKFIGDTEMEQASLEMIPAAVHKALDVNRLQTAKRFDYLRHGIGKDINGLSSVVENIVVDDDDTKPEEPEFVSEAPLFTPEQIDKLRAFKLKPEEMLDLYSHILEKAGLLSSEDSSTWYPKRSHRAADELFQVVINPVANNFSISGRSGAYKVASEERSLFDVIVVGGFHELEHVNQAQVDFELGKKLNIADLKGKRVSMFRESGANYSQRKAETALFGESKPIALAYARALQTLERGGDNFAATKAFYNEKRAILPNADASVIAKEASDRVLRLSRGGGLDSGSMSYAEEKILSQELQDASAEVKNRAYAVTSFDLVDQVRLHKYDLLPMPEKPAIDWTDFIMKEVEPYIIKALSQV